MIFYEEVWGKVKEGREHGYTMKRTAQLLGLTLNILKKLLYSKIIPPSVARVLEQTINRPFDTFYDIKHIYIYENLEAKFILWYVHNRFIGLPTYEMRDIHTKKFDMLKELSKNSVIINTIKIEMLIRVHTDNMIKGHDLYFFNEADRDNKSKIYINELKDLANINRELFYEKMGVIKNGCRKDTVESASGDIDIINTASVDFKPSQVITSQL